MRCPKCGNEVNQDEAFCGQCGIPTSQLVHPTEIIYTPQPSQSPQPQSGFLSSYHPNNSNMPSMPAPPSNVYNNGTAPPTNPYNPNSMPGGTAIPGQPPAAWPINPEQQSGFYQDPTEAMSVMPGNSQGYPQQGFAGYSGTGQYGPQVQPFRTGNYTQHGGFTQVPQLPSGQGYGYGIQPGPTPPPAKKPQAHAGIVIASICLAIALIAAIVFGLLYFTRGHSSPNAAITPTPVATAAPSPTATPIPSPTATATPAPSPTVTPTPAPDANFTWCGAICAAGGFIVEYPTGWNENQISNGVEFLNPAQQDEYATFKLPPTPANSNASQLVDTDLQNTYSGQPGYIAPTSKQITTIGGETWTYAIAYFLLNNQQKERVEVFATIHAGKGYVIELQAADSQFDAVNTQYFAVMIGRFQFQQSAS